MKIKASLEVGRETKESVLDIPDDWLEGESTYKKEQIIETFVQEWANGYIYIDWEKIE